MRQASSTSNSESKKMNISRKYLTYPLLVVCGIILLSLGCRLFDYLYVMPDEKTRIRWKSFYDQDEISNIFIGSSHVYRGVDVAMADEVLDGNCFNSSSASQRLQETYYVLLEADRKYDLKNVYLDLYYHVSTGADGDYSKTESITNSWRTTDYMKSGPVRTRAIFDMNNAAHIPDAYLPFLRFRKYIFDWEFISEQTELKKSDNYKNYLFHVDDEERPGVVDELTLDRKGFSYSNQTYEDLVYFQERTNENLHITGDAEKYLRRIIEYCQKHDIGLTLMSVPVYELQIIADHDYDTYLDSVQSIAGEYGLKIYDFNLVKDDYLSLSADDYMDIGHLNTQGADKFTALLLEVLKSDAPDEYFYPSFAEKLQSEKPRLYGLYRTRDGAENEIMLAASNDPDAEFEISLIYEDDTDEETSVLLREFDSARSITLPDDGCKMIRVRWRLKSDPQSIQTVDFDI